MVVGWVDEQQQGPPRELALPINGGEITIGRNPDAEIYLPSDQVSWRHVRVWRDPASGAWFAADTGSSNGTLLGQMPLPPNQPAALQPGTVLRVGPYALTFSSGSFQPQQAAAEQFYPSPSGMPPPPVPRGGTQILNVPVGNTLVIGRDPNSDIALQVPTASWKHARLTRSGNQSGWIIEDLNSANGTFVRNERITAPTQVQPGERIHIGLHTFVLGESGSLAHVPAGASAPLPGGGVAQVDSVALQAHNLRHVVSVKGESLTLLQNVSLSIAPQEMAALVGASGAGKTTLLLALNGYQPASEGNVTFNESSVYDMPELFRGAIGYVPQADIVHGDLPVESVLRYSARLRLPSDTSEAEIDQLIDQTLARLNLSGRRNNLVKTLSGGERKRVNIGVELLSHPSVLFLDEPTTGLDAGLERRIVEQLRALAQGGCTIVTVTHAIQTLDAYDKVAVMTPGGWLAFWGPPKEALQFFGARDYADMLDIAADPARPPGFWAQQFEQTRRSRPSPPPPRPAVSGAPRHAHRGGASVFGQFAALTARYVETIRNDSRNLTFWAAQAPLIALLIAVLFASGIFAGDQTADDKGRFPVQDAPNLMFLLSLSVTCFGLFNGAREIVKEKSIFYRERHIGLRMGPYVASKVVVLGAIAVVQCVLLFALVGLKINFHATGANGMWLLAILIGGSLNAILLGLLISAWSANPDQAVTLTAIAVLMQVIFSGLIPLERMNTLFQKLAVVCGLRWCYGGLCGAGEVSRRWDEASPAIGKQAGDVMKTDAHAAFFALLWLAIGLLAAVFGALMIRAQHDKKRQAG